jgi:hypothetical protein
MLRVHVKLVHNQKVIAGETGPFALVGYAASVATPFRLQTCNAYRKRVIMMAKNVPSKKTASRSTTARTSLPRTRSEKKKIRRAIFKTDHWYESAATSIGIAGRAKGVRTGATAGARTKDRID